ncbi:MAG TPA: histidine kinase, partial [Cytophagaceae bacterium]|nr:histidine kinase [Cytophagaceae bacterium]
VFFLVIWQTLSYGLLVVLLPSVDYIAFIDRSIPLRLVLGLFLYGIIALSYYLYKYYYSFKERIKRETDWNALMKEGELALLKSQLQPHFIFNTLNSIQALMLSDPERAQVMVVKLASFLRLSMTKHEEKLISLREELENSALYSDIEKIRFGDRLVIETYADEQVLSAVVPPLLLQPLIENAIRHGLHRFLGTVTISIQAASEEKEIRLSVSNNHDPQEQKQWGSGMGLKHVRRRLFLLYGRKDLAQVKDENGIFKIELVIPQY